MSNINPEVPITQRDYQGQIMKALMRFFNARDVEEFSILMRPDNEHSVLLNAVMQREKEVEDVYFFNESKEVRLEGHNGDTSLLTLPEGTLVVKYGELGEEKNTTIYVWKDDGGEVNYGTKTEK